jgi:hypothetical protein
MQIVKRTGLGEEGAEAVIGLGSLALLGEETIGLSGVTVRTLSLLAESEGSSDGCGFGLTWIPCSRQYSCKEGWVSLLASPWTTAISSRIYRSSDVVVLTYLPARVGNLATGLADYKAKSISKQVPSRTELPRSRGVGGVAVCLLDTGRSRRGGVGTDR